MGISLEDRINGTKIFFPNLVEGYRNRVNKYYLEPFQEKPEFFKIMNPTKLTAIHLEHDSVFLFSPYVHDYLDSIIAIDSINKEYEELKKDNAPDHIIEQFFLRVANLDKSQVFKTTKLYDLRLLAHGFDRINHNSALAAEAFVYGSGEADQEFLGYQLTISIEESFKPSTSYPLFDFQQLIQKVDSEDFRYELEESIKAYNAELYLAAASTAGIALENLLKLMIIRQLGPNKLPRDQYLKDLNSVLKRNQIIDERLYYRIQSYNPLRNSSSHTNSGQAKKEDAERAYLLIKELIDLRF